MWKYCKVIKNFYLNINVENGAFCHEFKVNEYFYIIEEGKGILPYKSLCYNEKDEFEFEYVRINTGYPWNFDYVIKKDWFEEHFKVISFDEYCDMPYIQAEEEEYEYYKRDDYLLYRTFKSYNKYNWNKAYEDDSIHYGNRRIDLDEGYIFIWVDNVEEETFNVDVYKDDGYNCVFEKENLNEEELMALIEEFNNEY